MAPHPTATGFPDYSHEELVADMGAALFSAETTLENQAAYVASWLETLEEDSQAVIIAAGACAVSGGPDPRAAAASGCENRRPQSRDCTTSHSPSAHTS